jgi:hypothetical protein
MFETKKKKKKKGEKWVYKMDYNLSPLDVMIDWSFNCDFKFQIHISRIYHLEILELVGTTCTNSMHSLATTIGMYASIWILV